MDFPHAPTPLGNDRGRAWRDTASALLLILATAGAFGIAVQTFMLLERSLSLAVVYGVASASVVGFLMSVLLFVLPARRTEADQRRLMDQLTRLARVQREEEFAILLQDRTPELAPLAAAVHRMLIETHRHRLHAARVERDMEHLVKEETKRATEHLSRLSSTDALTGLANRRKLDECLPDFFRTSTPDSDLAAIAIDMDYFKHINDSLGHAAGDRVLLALAQTLRGQSRMSDIAARVGGDEFTVLLRGVDERTAMSIASRLCELFSSHPTVRRLPGRKPSLSVGVALARRHGALSGEDLLHIADRALYAAKNSGRSRVVSASSLAYAQSLSENARRAG